MIPPTKLLAWPTWLIGPRLAKRIYSSARRGLAALAPAAYVYVAHEVPWVNLADVLPRFRNYPSEGDPEGS